MAVIEPPSREYLELIGAFPLRRIHTGDQFDAAVALSGQLIGRADLTDDEEEYLEVLCRLIEAYEDVHYPMPEAGGAAEEGADAQ